jgi:hypothetical protein
MPRTMTAEMLAKIRKETQIAANPLFGFLLKELDAECVVSKALADALDACVTGKYGGQPGFVNTLAISQARAALVQYAASHPEKEPNLEPR